MVLHQETCVISVRMSPGLYYVVCKQYINCKHQGTSSMSQKLLALLNMLFEIIALGRVKTFRSPVPAAAV